MAAVAKKDAGTLGVRRGAASKKATVRPSGTGIAAPAMSKVEDVQPMGKRLLVRPEETERTTAGGLLLSSSSGGEETGTGEILAAGDQVDSRLSVGVKVRFLAPCLQGQRRERKSEERALWLQVVLAGARGTDVEFFGGKQYRFVHEDDVLGILE